MKKTKNSKKLIFLDQTYRFFQEPSFWWTTGVDQPHCYALISVDNGETHLFAEKQPEVSKVWMTVLEVPDYLQQFEIDHAYYHEDLATKVKELDPKLLIISKGGKNPYSKVGPVYPDFPWMADYYVNGGHLYTILNEIRLRKTDEELVLIREAVKRGVDAHIFVMKNIKPGMNESHMQTLFRFMSRWFDHAAVSPYEEIVGGGKNAAVLHYHDDNQTLKDGDVVLMDMGVKTNYYCSDITTNLPVNGKFTEKQAQIYNVCLKANREIIKNAKAGINYQELQIIGEKVILQGLLDLGLYLNPDNETLEQLWEKRIIYTFFPHGIGHYIGLYVHDPPGDPKFEFQGRPIKKQNMRIRRVLEENMCVTIEPGIYFIEGLLTQAKEDEALTKYFDWEKVDAYKKEIQGVRVEDNIRILADGVELFTKKLPRTVEEIEAVMAGGEWST